MDTLSIDILLANLNNSAIHIFPCYSPVDGVNLCYYKRYLERYVNAGNHNDKELLILPLCNGIHFEGIIIDLKNRVVIHVDSLNYAPRNTVSLDIASIAFAHQEASPSFRSLFTTRKQSDGTSCGCWLVAGVLSYIERTGDIRSREQAFEFCERLLLRLIGNNIRLVLCVLSCSTQKNG